MCDTVCDITLLVSQLDDAVSLAMKKMKEETDAGTTLDDDIFVITSSTSSFGRFRAAVRARIPSHV